MDWQSARWIWLDENACMNSMQVMFQRDFRLDELPEQAELYITCDSVYRLRINGQWCADGPGRHFPESCPFDTIDCSSMLRSGLNRLEADVVEVKRGEWKCINNQHNYYEYHCSLCGRVERQEEPYCHCGAKMKGK